MVLAIAGFATACNNDSEKKETSDTTSTMVDTSAKMVDTSAKMVDTSASKMADTTKPKM